MWATFLYKLIFISLQMMKSLCCFELDSFSLHATDLHRYHSELHVLLLHEAAVSGAEGQATFSCRLWHLGYLWKTHAHFRHVSFVHHQEPGRAERHWGCQIHRRDHEGWRRVQQCKSNLSVPQTLSIIFCTLPFLPLVLPLFCFNSPACLILDLPKFWPQWIFFVCQNLPLLYSASSFDDSFFLSPSPPGYWGVEVRGHGAGSHSAMLIHGRVYHRDNRSLRRTPHRTQHVVSRKLTGDLKWS